MSVAQRIALGIAVAIAGLALVIGVVREQSTGGDAGPTGASVEDRGPDGLYVLGGLLGFAGHEVERVDASPSEAGLDPDTVTVLVDPGGLTATDADALRDLVEDGGVLILGGEVDAESLATVAGADLGELLPGSPALSRPLVPAPEVAGVAQVEARGEGAVEDGGPMLPVLEAGAGFTALVSSPGSGRLIVLADPSPLRNDSIALADNARFALALAGAPERPVRFVERVASAPGEGLAALPVDWRWAFAGLLLAALVLVAAKARRLGPPERRARELPPPRRRYVDAVATSLARTGQPDSASEPLRAAARERLLIRAGLPRDADPDRVHAAARAAGLDDDEAAAVLTPGGGDRAAIDAGRALAKLARTRT